jgi:hypothetical protein
MNLHTQLWTNGRLLWDLPTDEAVASLFGRIGWQYDRTTNTLSPSLKKRPER